MKTIQLSNKVVFLLLSILCLLFYGNSITNGFSLDDNYIFQQIPEDGSSFAATFKVFTQRYDFMDYRPVAMFTFALEQYFLGKIYPEFSHALNILFYLLLTFSIYSIVLRLPVKNAPSIALLTAILFLAHPVHANTVNNLKSRDTILSMLAGMWSFYFIVIRLHTASNPSRKWIYLIAGMLLFIIAVNTKRDSMSFVLLVPFTLLFFNLRSLKSSLYAGISLIIVLSVSSLFIDYTVPEEISQGNAVLFTENPIVAHWTIPYRISQALSSYAWYLKFMFIPGGYHFYYGYNTIALEPLYHLLPLLFIVLHLAILYFAYYLYQKEEKAGTFGILFFYLSLLYCANFITPVAGIVADRYVFIGSLGFCLWVAWAIHKAIDRILPEDATKPAANGGKKAAVKSSSNRYRGHLYLTLFVIVVSVFYLPTTWARNHAWKDILSLMNEDTPHLKQSFQANRIAVTHYIKAAKTMQLPDSAQALYAQALTCANNADAVYPNDIFILESKGISYMGLRNTAAAFQVFNKVNHLTDSSLVSLDIVGDIYYRRKAIDTAMYYYYRTLKLDTLTDVGYYKFITALSALGRHEGALYFSDSIIQRRPDFEVSYECKGLSYLFNSDTSKAGDEYLTAFTKGMQSSAFAQLFHAYYLRHNQPEKAGKFTPYLSGQRQAMP